MADGLRLDRFLWFARIVKTRALAQAMAEGGRIRIGGRVVEVGLDETGDPVVLAELSRGAVKRFRRTNGSYHFNIGYHVPETDSH